MDLSVTLADGRTLTESGEFRTLLGEGFGNASRFRAARCCSATSRTSCTRIVSVKVANATGFASGVGCFAIKIDNEPVSSSFTDPGWATLPTARVTYRAFDLTSHCVSGASKAAAGIPRDVQVRLSELASVLTLRTERARRFSSPRM